MMDKYESELARRLAVQKTTCDQTAASVPEAAEYPGGDLRALVRKPTAWERLSRNNRRAAGIAMIAFMALTLGGTGYAVGLRAGLAARPAPGPAPAPPPHTSSVTGGTSVPVTYQRTTHVVRNAQGDLDLNVTRAAEWDWTGRDITPKQGGSRIWIPLPTGTARVELKYLVAAPFATPWGLRVEAAATADGPWHILDERCPGGDITVQSWDLPDALRGVATLWVRLGGVDIPDGVRPFWIQIAALVPETAR